LAKVFHTKDVIYRRLCRCHHSLHGGRETVKKTRKLKDGAGQYIWQLGLASGKPDTILGVPYFESEYAPSAFTAGKYIEIVGDFSNYWIVDALSMAIQRLVELYAATNQVGFIGRQELDGMPVLEEAFARVTLAS
jgi:HK97 family phage major capsid protein